MSESLITIESAPLTLAPRPPVNPVDVYIDSLSSKASMCTMRGALCGAVRVLARAGKIALDPERVTFEDVRNLRWHLFDNAAMESIRSLLIQNFEPAGAMLKIAAIKGVLKKARRNKLMTAEQYSDATDIDPIKVNHADVGKSVSDEDLDKLFSACTGDYMAARDKAIIAVLIYSGLRRNELSMLDVGDYVPEEASIFVRFGKGKKKRTAYICTDGREILDEWMEARALVLKSKPLPIFLGYRRDGRINPEGRLTPESIRLVLERRSDQAGIARVKPHDCRRTFITKLLEAGADLFLIQSLVGHADPATTKRYDRRGEKGKREVVELLSKKKDGRE